jgi:acyl carrier protein
MSQIANEIMNIFAEKMSKDNGVLNLSDRLDQLGLDSLQVTELTFVIEEKFDIEIPYTAGDIEAKTVADLIQTVEQLVALKGRPS